MHNFTFVTGNAAKAQQLGTHLLMNELPRHRKLDLPEIQSLDLSEVVKAKAESAYKLVQSPVLVEDVSLTLQALGRLPGPLIKWFLEELGNDGLVKLADGYQDRRARAQVIFAYYDGTQLRLFEGEANGRIADQPRGLQGFGFDPIFIPEGYDLTWSEMNEDQQAQTSMRRLALEKLASWL